MRWRASEPGETRERIVCLWLPALVDGDWVWLERVRVIERLQEVDDGVEMERWWTTERAEVLR